MSELITQSHRTLVLDDGTSWFFGAGEKGKIHMRSADWTAPVQFGDVTVEIAMLPTWTSAGASSMPGYANNVQVKVNQIWHNRCKEIDPKITMQGAIDRLCVLSAETKAERKAQQEAKAKATAASTEAAM